MRFSDRFCYLFSMLRLINTWNKTYNTRCTTHNDIQHVTRPIEFTRATRSTSIFTTRQEAAETSHMQHATYIADNMRRGGEFPSWDSPLSGGWTLPAWARTVQDSKNRPETPRDATRRHETTLRDATRRNETPQDVLRRLRDASRRDFAAHFF